MTDDEDAEFQTMGETDPADVEYMSLTRFSGHFVCRDQAASVTVASLLS
jgi:hypothetical protein